jgi:hypothetical protein
VSDSVIQHVRSFFGSEPKGGIVGEVAPGVDLAFVISTEHPFAVVTTSGLSATGITAIFPQEIVCFTRPDQWEAARALVAMTAENVLSRGSGLVLGDVISAPEPLLADTQITGVLAYGNGYFDPSFDAIRAVDGSVAVQLVTIIPLTSSEAAFLSGAQNGEPAFFEAMTAQGISELDVTRASAI